MEGFKINMINLFFLSKYKKTKNTRDDPNTMHTHDVMNTYEDNTIRPRWTHTSIGPSNWSEEVCLSVMINRRQTEDDMRERAVKVPLHLHRNPRPHGINSQTLSLWECVELYRNVRIIDLNLSVGITNPRRLNLIFIPSVTVKHYIYIVQVDLDIYLHFYK